MKQIYYTQCPIGYGLGASNGFQIKRLSPGYPITGDFRHLGLRAFVGGSRVMAPPTLRYRRGEDGMAEVASLIPRSHEYETERGLWGRPGGQFAHGLRLEEAELDAIEDWPAGLFGQPFWTKSDPVPSRGQPPEPLELSTANLSGPPGFETAATLARGTDVEVLAALLSALARAVRDNRTLFLIDAPEHLADRIALLTLALPSPWRKAVTFSTYHDRPEELPGYRIQGTIPSARPNRMALLSLGIIADLVSGGTVEPANPTARWASTLAGWLVRGSSADREAWKATDRRAKAAASKSAPEVYWGDDWLDRLYEFDAWVRQPAMVPTSPTLWKDLSEEIHWGALSGLSGELVEARGPEWWGGVACQAAEAWAALLAQVALPAAWRGEGMPRRWGAALAEWVRVGSEADRTRLLSAAIRAAHPEARPGFVRALLGALDEPTARATLAWLKTGDTLDEASLLPLEVPGAIADAIDRRDPRAFGAIVSRSVALSGALPAVLDALASEVSSRGLAVDRLAEPLGKALDGADIPAVSAFLRWALRREDARDWAGGYLRRTLADPSNEELWLTLHRLVPSPLAANWASVVLGVARDDEALRGAFRWGVENILLTLPESGRPHDPSWPGAYLDRMPSGLGLIKRMFTKEYRSLGMKPWLDGALARGELTAEHVERLAGCERFARALRSGDARALLKVKLPDVPPEERGTLLRQILSRLEDDRDDSFHIALDTCRDAWPGAFHPGEPGLLGIARTLADAISVHRADPRAWTDRLFRILDRLGLEDRADGRFAPDGLASEIVAETTRHEGDGFDPWRLRQALLRHDSAWRILAADIRRDLHGGTLTERLAAFSRWDERLDKGVHSSRFFEVALNGCDGATLAAVVPPQAASLRSLPSLSWWRWRESPDARDDLRDAFCRLAPMAPLPNATLSTLDAWLRPTRGGKPTAGAGGSTAADSPLSPRGLLRWRCLQALSEFHDSGRETASCWNQIDSWRGFLPMGELEPGERYAFAAWLIHRLDEFDLFQVSRLAKWLFDCGIHEPDRLARWSEELGDVGTAIGSVQLDRAALGGELRVELKNVIRDSRAKR